MALASVWTLHAQTPDLKTHVSGGEMMEELIRLTQVPLAEEPLHFQGHLACNLSRGARTSVGEIRWAQDHSMLLWTDQVDRHGQYTLRKSADAPLATIHLENREGSYMSPEMMTMAGYWSEEANKAPRTLKADKKLEPMEVMGHPCTAHSGKEGKERVVVWMTDAAGLKLDDTQLEAYREAFAGWMTYRPDKVLRNLALPAGVPLKVEWGVADEDGALPNAMELVTLNAAAQFNLDAPNLWMQVPGRDINQVAKEMQEKEASKAASGGAKDAAPADGE